MARVLHSVPTAVGDKRDGRLRPMEGRLVAAGAWLDKAAKGEVDEVTAVDAATNLFLSVAAFLQLRDEAPGA